MKKRKQKPQKKHIRHPLTKDIPEHLLRYVVQQENALYTPMDHASWRFILKLSRRFFSKHAHQKYLKGLSETGISTEHIPSIAQMDAKLRKFNWRAVAVSGFIPPSVFMEFLSLGVLPIACDMRKFENIAYTPAPDIVHEAAGHAPIVADPDYADYLRSYGEISRKAIFSRQDIELYLAIRDLSELKENPKTTPKQLDDAEARLQKISSEHHTPSEAAKLARMGWWTFEYGLLGNLTKPKIYGAGLLSSVGESYHCLSSEVKKIPFSVKCVETSYDITKPQPQLFVASSFASLKKGLNDLANTMAFRLGGKRAMEIGKQAQTTITIQLDSGLQITGTLSNYLSEKDKIHFFRLSGPVQLAYEDVEIQGHGLWMHSSGYSSPLGKIKSGNKWIHPSLWNPSKDPIQRLEFESGVILKGQFVRRFQKNKKNILITFDLCSVSKDKEIFYDPTWGRFDLACGIEIASVFGGAADRSKYPDPTEMEDQVRGAVVRTQKSNLTRENESLNRLYYQVRLLREDRSLSKSWIETELSKIHQSLSEENDFKNDWLIRYELLELTQDHKNSKNLQSVLESELTQIAQSSRQTHELITRGLECLGH